MAGEQTKFTTSFIPKKPVTPTVTGYKTSSNIFGLIGFAIFFGVIAFGGGVFGYKIVVQQQIKTQIETLERDKKSFDEKFVQEATRLNTRLIEIKKLLDNHQAPSIVFDIIEKNTLQTVRFNSFKYALDNTKNTVNIDASGIGLNYESIILQSDQYTKEGVFQSPVFSSVQPNETGIISFSFSANLDPKLFLYRKRLNNSQTQNSNQDVSFNNIFE